MFNRIICERSIDHYFLRLTINPKKINKKGLTGEKKGGNINKLSRRGSGSLKTTQQQLTKAK